MRRKNPQIRLVLPVTLESVLDKSSCCSWDDAQPNISFHGSAPSCDWLVSITAGTQFSVLDQSYHFIVHLGASCDWPVVGSTNTQFTAHPIISFHCLALSCDWLVVGSTCTLFSAQHTDQSMSFIFFHSTNFLRSYTTPSILSIHSLLSFIYQMGIL